MRPKSPKLPLVSVVIPVEPEGDPAPCLAAVRRLNWPKSSLEILLVRGRHPSRQRNLAVAKAGGEWILFLDSDSRPAPDLVERLLEAARELGAAVAGGPNLPLPGAPALERAFSAVLASWLGSMSARARYAPVGSRRLSSEKELILCNLLVRAREFRDFGGFREDLYPNEENEFLNRLQSSGLRLAYAPDAWVHRPRRQSLSAFAKQAFNYGRGRMRQILTNPYPRDLVNLLPLAGLIYLAAAWHWAPPPFVWAPLVSYLALATAFGTTPLPEILHTQAYRLSYGHGVGLVLIPLRHASYALGLLVGLVSAGPAARTGGNIKVERLKP